MKIKRGFVLFIISILVFLILFFNTYSYAYSTSDYSIDIPYSYTNQGDGSFIGATGQPYIFISTERNSSYEYWKYEKEYLKILEDFIIQYTNDELIKTIPSGYDYSFKVIDSKITKFTDNNYNCFYFNFKFDIETYSIYLKFYVVLTADNEMYSIILTGTDEVLNSKEVQDIINSFEIKNYIPKDNSTILSFDTIAAICAGVIILLVAILYIMKKRDDKKNIKLNNDKIDIDEYVISTNYSEPKQPQNSKVKDALFAMAFMFCIGTVAAIFMGNLYIILDLILTIIAYMLYPFCCLVSGNKYSKKEAAKIAIINSVVVAIIFIILRSLIADVNSISVVTAFVYGTINYNLLKNDENINDNNETEDK